MKYWVLLQLLELMIIILIVTIIMILVVLMLVIAITLFLSLIFASPLSVFKMRALVIMWPLQSHVECCLSLLIPVYKNKASHRWKETNTFKVIPNFLHIKAHCLLHSTTLRSTYQPSVTKYVISTSQKRTRCDIQQCGKLQDRTATAYLRWNFEIGILGQFFVCIRESYSFFVGTSGFLRIAFVVWWWPFRAIKWSNELPSS